MDDLTDKAICEGVAILTENDVRNVLREILRMIRNDTFAYPKPQTIYIPFKLWEVLKGIQ